MHQDVAELRLHVQERVFQGPELIDLDALSEPGREQRLPRIEQRVAHALQVVRDEQQRDLRLSV
jgi:hypothetical protein